MADSHDLGQKGEDLAAEHLKNNGYSILFRNWKWGKNEIDIIARKNKTLVFVEVKTRSGDFKMHPVTAVTNEKQKTIILAADGYIKRYNIDLESRFDIITVVNNNETFEIDHIEAAFYPTLR